MLGGGALAIGGLLRKPGVGGADCDVDTPPAPGANALDPGLGGALAKGKGPPAGTGGVTCGAPGGACTTPP